MSSPVDGPLPDGSGAGWYVIATLVSLIAGTSLFAWRAPVLEAFDRTETTTLTLGQGPGAGDDGWSHHALGDMNSTSHSLDLSVTVCPETGELAEDTGIQLACLDQAGVSLWQRPPLGVEPGAADPAGSTVYRADGCIAFHRRDTIERCALTLSWTNAYAADRDTSIEVLQSTRLPLGPTDRAIVLLFALGAILLLLAGQRTPSREPQWTAVEATAVLVVFFVASVIFGAAAVGGALAGMLAMLAIHASYLGFAATRGRRHTPDAPLAAFAFNRVQPKALALCALVGVLTAVGAAVLLQALPHGESAMTEALRPSAGLLRLAALALVAPWAEELLIRGVIYGALQRASGHLAAVVGSTLLFSLLHVQQHVGSLGPWMVVTLTGLILSLVRWRTGSTAGSTVAHLAYNALLITPSFLLG